MFTQVINGQMSITRNSHDMINIRAKCSSSGIGFLSMELTPTQFTMLVTGCVESDIPMTVFGLDVVGKQRIREERQIVCDLDSYNKDVLKQWLIENAQEEGWILDTYLGSQSSVRRVGNESILSYSVHKFVDTVGE